MLAVWLLVLFCSKKQMLAQKTFSHPQQGRIDFNTVNPSLSTGMAFLIHPCRWIDDEENVRTPPKLGRYWEIHPLCPRDFPRPWRCHLGLGKSLGCRGWISQIHNPLFAENFIRKEWEGVTPKSVTYFLDQNQVFFEQYTQFLAFKKKYREMSVKLGRGGTPKIWTPFLPKILSVKGGGGGGGGTCL